MKASFTLGTATDKAINITVAIIVAMSWVFYPLIVKADSGLQRSGEQALVFEVKNLPDNAPALKENSDKIVLASVTTVSDDVDFQARTAYKELLRDYLAQRNSPLADCADLFVQLKTADKILSLANAESGLGRRYPANTANLWGVNGGYSKMGNSVCDAVINMDTFLQTYPRNSSLKYADMSIDQMCGLYKQPCPGRSRNHWVRNNHAILNDLQALRAQAQQIAQARVSPPILAATAELSVQ